MYRYLPDTPEDIQKMLDVIGVDQVEDLFSDIDADLCLDDELAIAEGLDEYQLLKELSQLAAKNITASQQPIFLGAGTYDHVIPSVVPAVVSRSEFLTAYTPYQAEASQGELQAIFEFQSMISELTGMDVTNSSLYDGFASLSEAMALASSVKRKTSEIVIARSVHPNGREVVKANAKGRKIKVNEAPLKGDQVDLEALKDLVSDQTMAVLVQSPNFFGTIEDLRAIKAIAEQAGALFVVMANPLSLALLEAPGKLGADVVVGDTQVFGLPMSYGGPHCGYFSVKEDYIRRVPGRMVGETVDADGKRGYVLTLQSREQHIRREKATSYMSSNQALCALASAVCMAWLGREGVRHMAQLNIDNTHYLAQQLTEKGFKVWNKNAFFNEFVLELPLEADKVNEKLYERGITGGYSLAKDYDEPNHLLLCATEKRTKEEMDCLVKELEGIVNG